MITQISNNNKLNKAIIIMKRFRCAGVECFNNKIHWMIKPNSCERAIQSAHRFFDDFFSRSSQYLFYIFGFTAECTFRHKHTYIQHINKQLINMFVRNDLAEAAKTSINKLYLFVVQIIDRQKRWNEKWARQRERRREMLLKIRKWWTNQLQY